MAEQDGKAAEAPGYAAFESRDDLTSYGDNALLLFVAQLRLGFDDASRLVGQASRLCYPCGFERIFGRDHNLVRS